MHRVPLFACRASGRLKSTCGIFLWESELRESEAPAELGYASNGVELASGKVAELVNGFRYKMGAYPAYPLDSTPFGYASAGASPPVNMFPVILPCQFIGWEGEAVNSQFTN